MIRIKELKLPLDSDENELLSLSAKALRCSADEFKSIRVIKKAVDSRNKNNVFFVCNVLADVKFDEQSIVKRSHNSKVELFDLPKYEMPENRRKSNLRPVIAGFGPAGFFSGLILARAGLKPLVVERGADVDTRTGHVNNFWNNKVLNRESNVQFGEGGAGTFSDGKLTTGIKDPLCFKVISELVAHGAPEEILYSATPHIGTDKLPDVVKKIREEIISLGGEILFNTKLTDIIVANNAIQGVTLFSDNKSFDFETDALLLCIGHSARDTVNMLYEKGVEMMQKPFSVGARIEHPRELIDKAQYGDFAGHPKLGAAVYKMACHPPHGRGAYTFCMCPGGTVVSAASEKEMCVVNGMSRYARDGENSNSALLVGIEPENFGSSHPLAGIDLQRKIEHKAFLAGGGDYSCPCQLVGDFLNNKPTKSLLSVKPSCTGGVTPGDISLTLPEKITDTMRAAILKMDSMLNGFAFPEAVLTAPETRSSSPVRIIRNDYFQSNISGIYPCGEGAGYAGGIVSAAVDGIKCAHAVLGDERIDIAP
ncbi:MAG: hypothetical protein IKR90_05640 [Clostridia bacterium]|nr:hypothetical protein [Clostridia bacterium]